jgi:AcrR family transcriptional regulator
MAELPSVTLLLRVRGNTDVERAALARRRRIDAELADMVRDARDAGALRADVDPALVARLVFGTVNSLVEWYRPRPDAGPEQVADALCAMVFDGLRRH